MSLPSVILAAPAASTSLGQVFASEVLGTAFLIILGAGVVANNILKGNKGLGGGWLMISWGWALGVFAGVIVAAKSGAHLNPAVTLGLLSSGAEEYAPGVAVSFGSTMTYLAAELVGAFLGAVVAWLAYKQHFDAEESQAAKLGVFSTGPQIRSYAWNLVTEVIATFVLVFAILATNAITKSGGEWPGALGPLPVALIVLAIGVSLGGPTGYAINPARDLGPRIAHAILPIKGKGSSDWSYSWVPIVGPIVGGVLAGLASIAVF
ncbi:MIP/aquaporin family protein [Saxibacter everestensis]|uniref:MIP/aquaporin family protein n=1 Tax=Saxibacter everestensis TaxID=2909229 RepID=A0ABY8QVX5_9MICO|nr:MIP/aquaporin family protein [Brevibacteriaceae bacterium ZFBP1038]